jgi:hypothetical protein
MDDNAIRTRRVCLARSDDNRQAERACASLNGIQGVISAEPLNDRQLMLSYSLEYLSFELIEGLLKELGFYLDNSLPAIIRRNVFQYLEDNAREKLRVEREEQRLACSVDFDSRQEPDKYWTDYH